MKIRKDLAIAILAIVVLCASSLMPTKFNEAAALPGGPSVVVVTPASPTPWGVIAVGAGVIGILLDAAIVSNTQCRELTLQEAYTSALLPIIGIAFNGNANRCGRRRR